MTFALRGQINFILHAIPDIFIKLLAIFYEQLHILSENNLGRLNFSYHHQNFLLCFHPMNDRCYCCPPNQKKDRKL